MGAGDLALRAGQTDEAVDALSTAIAEIPNLAGDPWWAADPARKALFPRILDAAIVKAPGADWVITLMAGQTDQARSLAAALPDSSAALSLIAAWSGDAVATSELYDQCLAHPLDIDLLQWCGLVAAHHGTDELSGKFQRVADLIITGSSAAATETRVNPAVPIGPIAGNPAAFWGTFTYRRPTPADVLVPSLVHLAIR